jgi:hypothetical protein
MEKTGQDPSIFRRLGNLIGWTKHSTVLLGGFFLIVLLIAYIWWPLAEEVLAYVDWHGPWWEYIDWLLLGIFLFMSLTIMTRADLRVDVLIVLVGMVGGLVIESWGTQTNLWFYYTAERPPLWIIPAWPIASLSIDRITRLLNWGVERFRAQKKDPGKAAGDGSRETAARDFLPLVFEAAYWVIFIGFLILMLAFVAPTFDKSYTLMATLLVVLLIFTPNDQRTAVLTFLAGSGLGYFLELWGTTRQCWTYYTFQTPPFFAVLAHGMAAVAFWRGGLIVKLVWGKIMNRSRLKRDLQEM